jgi:hypothetical protein
MEEKSALKDAFQNIVDGLVEDLEEQKFHGTGGA